MTDYDLSKIRGLAFDVDGVLSPTVIPMNAEGLPLRMVNIKDGYALQLAIKQGLHLAIITGGTTQAVETRFRTLGLKDIYQGVAHKVPVLHEWMKLHDLHKEEVIYMGDDIPDLHCMQEAGLACAPSDAAPEILQAAGYISPYAGGHGCVRDILAQVLAAKGLWMNDAKAFGW